MKKIFCFSTQKDFQENLPQGFGDNLKKYLDADDVSFHQFMVDGSGRYYVTNVDWEKVKEEGVNIVVLCDDSHQLVLDTFFHEAFKYLRPEKILWYGRSGSTPFLAELKMLKA